LGTSKKQGANLLTQEIKIALRHLLGRRSENGASLRFGVVGRVVLLRFTKGKE